MLGVLKGKVKLEKYDYRWQEEFEKEKDRLNQLIGEYIKGIEHIGSTSIPGLVAKPIIDIAVIVEKLNNEAKYLNILKESGYQYRDDNGEKCEFLFKKINKNNETTHFIHIIERNGVRYNNYILFKNYLLKHKEEIKNYNQLKQNLYEKYKDNREKYTIEKNEYITSIIEKSKNEIYYN